MKCYAKSSENLIVQLANLPPKPPFLSKSFHLFSCTGKTHYLCISSAKNKEQNKTFLPFNFQNIGRQLVQYAASEIVFDIDKIKAILNDENDKRDATDVIDSASSRNLYDENKDDHYFIVTLCNIDLQYPALLNKDIIADYLREVAPVDYSAQFRNQLIMTSVSGEYEELQKNVGYFPISINGTAIEKRYGLRVVGTNDTINGLEYFSLKDDTYGLLAWGWYALTDFTKAIPVSDTSSQFRLRKHNIQVGEADMLTTYFPRNETRGNKYFYGEIHIANQKIKLNSARDGLAPTPEAECLKCLIRNFFDGLVKLYHLANYNRKIHLYRL